MSTWGKLAFFDILCGGVTVTVTVVLYERITASAGEYGNILSHFGSRGSGEAGAVYRGIVPEVQDST